MSLRIHYLQNLSTAHIGNIKNWAETKGYQLSGSHLFNGDAFPELDQFDVLIILGGIPGECEGWLKDEIKFIKKAVDAGKGVVGICLGSQLIACALGGELVPNEYAESGWLQVSFNESALHHPLLKGVTDRELFFFHRNKAVLPESFVLHASSEGCKNQVFTYEDRVIGIQSHPEMVATTIENLAREKADSLPQGPYNKICLEDACQTSKLSEAAAMISQILDNLCELLETNKKPY